MCFLAWYPCVHKMDILLPGFLVNCDKHQIFCCISMPLIFYGSLLARFTFLPHVSPYKNKFLLCFFLIFPINPFLVCCNATLALGKILHTIQMFGVSKICECLMLIKDAISWLKIQRNSSIVTFSVLYTVFNVLSVLKTVANVFGKTYMLHF